MGDRAVTEWVRELDRPTEAFFRVLAARVEAPDGVAGAVHDAVLHLVPRVDWHGYLPQVPHGLLGLASVLELRPHIESRSFLRLVATQLHAFAVEGRAPHSLSALGSGHWPNIELALREHRASIAWGELMAVENPCASDFRRLLPFAAPDMANIGHKAVAVVAMERLWENLGRAQGLGRPLLAWAGWLVASAPEDRFWRARMTRRFEGASVRVDVGDALQDEAWHRGLAREICDLGLVALLDTMALRVKAGVRSGDLLTGLVLAASEKMLDARQDLEGKTAWNLVYLAALGRHLATLDQPEVWGQAAALVNFFPSDAPEDRLEPKVPEADSGSLASALLEALLDGEPALALGLALEVGDPGILAEVLANAASRNDPGLNQSSQVMAVAAALDLMPLLPSHATSAMLCALAKSLANSPGSDELGRRADKALAGMA